MKKALSLMLAIVLTLSMSAVAFAAESDRGDYEDKLNVNAKFNKVYQLTHPGTSNPEETFTFSFKAVGVKEQESGITLEDAPAIPNVTVKFDAGTATTEGLKKAVEVPLSASMFPGIGIYTYEVTEVAGNTAGVVYNTEPMFLVVTILRDTDDQIKFVAAVHYETEDGDKTGDVLNKYEAGNLQVKKNVTGNMGEKDRYFKVSVTLTGETGKTYLDSYKVTGGTKIEDGETHCIESSIKVGETKDFYLMHGETINIENLPYGVTYVVNEADYTADDKGGYDDPDYNYSDDAGKKIDSELDTVVITNNKGAVVDTGIALDNMPYIVMLMVVFAGLAMFVAKKRNSYEN